MDLTVVIGDWTTVGTIFTIYTGETGNSDPVEKSTCAPHSVWEAPKDTGCFDVMRFFNSF